MTARDKPERQAELARSFAKLVDEQTDLNGRAQASCYALAHVLEYVDRLIGITEVQGVGPTLPQSDFVLVIRGAIVTLQRLATSWNGAQQAGLVELSAAIERLSRRPDASSVKEVAACAQHLASQFELG